MTGHGPTGSAVTPPPQPSQLPPLSAAATPAAGPGGVKVGIIDIQQAIIGTNEGARDFDALQKKFEPRRNELSNLNTEIDNLKKQQLNTQGDKMNEEAHATLVKSIETKQKSLQRSAEDAQNDYQQQSNEIAQRILQKMAPVIDKYCRCSMATVCCSIRRTPGRRVRYSGPPPVSISPRLSWMLITLSQA